MKHSSYAFTYIEVLITLAIMAVLFIPMMQLFSHSIYSTTVSGDMITAVNLARGEMEKVRNLNLTKAQLRNIGDVWTPALEEPPLEVNNKTKWRVLRRIKPGSDPLEVWVEVYRADDLKKPAVSLVTLIEDNVWLERGAVLQ
jgi:type II secretory pathway pseudopilin PulG